MEQAIFVGIGYAGMLFVVLSMMMTKMIYLRYLNSAGCLLTVLYTIGLLIVAGTADIIPVLVLNSVLLIINIVQLIRYYRHQRKYDVINATISGFTIKHFVSRFRNQIMWQNPLFFNRYPDSNYAKVIFCNDTVVGMLIGRRDGDILQVFTDFLEHDYVKPELMNLIRSEVHEDGINKEIFKYIPEKFHKNYLKFGCTQVGNNDFIFEHSA